MNDAEKITPTDAASVHTTGDVELQKPDKTINASGHVQELERNYSLLSMCAVAIVIGNCWAIAGGLAIYNGGPPGFIYQLQVYEPNIVSGILYLFITASLAELASAIPSAGGVYHWASVTPGRKIGRICGFFAGYWNSLAYMFGACSLAAVSSEGLVELYALRHPGTKPKNWHIFVCYLVIIWLCVAILLFGNRLLPRINSVLMFLVIGGWFVTLIVVGVMSTQGGRSHASSDFVWKKWQNNTGYTSDGLVFVLGMLNGFFAIGTPDCTTHMSEEIKEPEHNIPKAMVIQMMSSFLTTLIYLIVIFYAISDFDTVLGSAETFFLAEIYHQATGSLSGCIGLSIIVIVPVMGSSLGSMLTASRVFWSLARDQATPFPDTFGHVSDKWKNPFAAILFTGCFATVMGCIYLGSSTAFEAFVGSFVVLTTFSYLAALLPFPFSGRKSVPAGPFFIKGTLGFAVNIVSCAFMTVWLVFYCFPYIYPVQAENMNYSSLIAGGLTIILVGIWVFVQGVYESPPVVLKRD
ncbi:choline transport protein [Amniculicola lignicola CBS 123094]|uniref:Choline transport protein n=1 Tax=Amniculicola lignicola CBS 123094 TaxID=1392246 RepID=A0A6A5W3I5_9PLEO|nr:choline transport protein [Amniculicola lignicola CBS 123094]